MGIKRSHTAVQHTHSSADPHQTSMSWSGMHEPFSWADTSESAAKRRGREVLKNFIMQWRRLVVKSLSVRVVDEDVTQHKVEGLAFSMRGETSRA